MKLSEVQTYIHYNKNIKECKNINLWQVLYERCN